MSIRKNMLASTKTDLKTVADLEDALDLCGIDKEIKIL